MRLCVLAVLLVAVLAVVSAQYQRVPPRYRRVPSVLPRYRRPVRIPIPLPNKGDRYAASLAGAPVGLDQYGDQYKPIKQ
ncbi:hypothetical protein JTE90_015063 [Oedothorax gibbosus]|uniref:Uncharacterized protein n=1 Tax=Oedothorax gibbosus TaxID=931172 RepID=A0AAV6VSU5_9ARAC|nr:hypothetical protein JTE90_015063 [Oedothorax gibbosus]